MATQSSFSDLPKLNFFRYENFFNIYKEKDGTKFYNLLRNINVFPAKDSSVEDLYTVKEHDTWYYISYKYYGTMDLWWLVCEYNQIKDATKIPDVGTVIRLLKNDYVWAVVTELNRQTSG